jgi:hypothetical protein
MKLDVLLELKHGSDYFDQSALLRAEFQNEKSRDILIYCSPDWFLSMAKKITTPDKGKADGVNAAFENGIKFDDIPFLVLSNEGGESYVVGHEGRHRAMFLKSKNINEMPVILKSYNIRWGCQTNPEFRYDYIPVWPETLQSENGKKSKFPLERDAFFKAPENRLKV